MKFLLSYFHIVPSLFLISWINCQIYPSSRLAHKFHNGQTPSYLGRSRFIHTVPYLRKKAFLPGSVEGLPGAPPEFRNEKVLPTTPLIRAPRGLKDVLPNDAIKSLKKSLMEQPASVWNGKGKSTKVAKTFAVKRPYSSKGPIYIFIAAAAYCPMKKLKKWKCVFCKELPEIKFVNGTTNKSNYVIFIAQDDDSKQLFLSISGFQNIKAVIKTSANTLVPPDVGESGILVHKKFNSAAKELMPFVQENLKPLSEKLSDYKITFTGHGCGGAIVELVYFYSIQKNLFPKQTLEIYTFGAPKVGNRKWADFMNSQPIQIGRVVNGADIVAHLPFGGIPYPTTLTSKKKLDYFYHHATELWVLPNTQIPITCSDEFYEDPQCSNSLALFYNINDHLKYFDADLLECDKENFSDLTVV